MSCRFETIWVSILFGAFAFNLQSGATGRGKGFETCFVRVPQAVGLNCSCNAGHASKGNFQKTCHRAFFTSCRPRLYKTVICNINNPTKTTFPGRCRSGGSLSGAAPSRSTSANSSSHRGRSCSTWPRRRGRGPHRRRPTRARTRERCTSWARSSTRTAPARGQLVSCWLLSWL